MTDKALEQYFEASSSWDADRAARSKRSARIAWTVATFAMLCALASSGALALLMPLKRVDPFLIRVDNTTGIVDVVPVYAGKKDLGDVVTRLLIRQYITACERFSYFTAEHDYNDCAAFHGDARNRAWLEQWTRTNPNSPLNLHKDGSTISTDIKSITFLSGAPGDASRLVQVRFTKIRRSPDGVENRTPWIATLQYAYGEPSKKVEVANANPIGFRILDYRTEPELGVTP